MDKEQTQHPVQQKDKSDEDQMEVYLVPIIFI